MAFYITFARLIEPVLHIIVHNIDTATYSTYQKSIAYFTCTRKNHHKVATVKMCKPIFCYFLKLIMKIRAAPALIWVFAALINLNTISNTHAAYIPSPSSKGKWQQQRPLKRLCLRPYLCPRQCLCIHPSLCLCQCLCIHPSLCPRQCQCFHHSQVSASTYVSTR